MKKGLFLLGMLWLVTACGVLPQVRPLQGTLPAELLQSCGRLFPPGRWQFVHSIETALAPGRQGVLLGVTRISSRAQTIQAVVMTLEGLVLLDARYDRRLVVNRSLGPFDDRDLAGGLMEDIRLIFFRPPGAAAVAGILENGAAVCRYPAPDGRVTDIVRHPGQRWRLEQYGPESLKKRTVEMFFGLDALKPGSFDAPKRMILTSHEAPGYRLDMHLIEALPLFP